MKTFISLVSLAFLLSACSGGMSAHDSQPIVDTHTSGTIPDFDFTEHTADPDIDVEFPVAETTTTSKTPPEISISTSTTLTIVTTTTLKSVVTTTTFVSDGDEIVVIGPKIPGNEKEIEIGFDASKIIPGASNDDFVGSAQMSPTIYYIKTLDENSGEYSCASGQKVTMLGKDQKELLKVCPKTYAKCKLEGSCTIVQGDKRIPINYSNQVKYEVEGKTYTKYLFFIFDVNICPYGLGVRNGLCLDPYYTVAADLTVYKVGEVIFIPALVGLDMGRGVRHHGFVIVRDMGHSIKGRGRFDFFTGYQTAVNPKNPFKAMKLADSTTRLKYYRVKIGSSVEKFVKGMRNYPLTPVSKK